MTAGGSGDRITDPLLAAAMRELREETPPSVEWDRLRTSINASATLPLRRRRWRRNALSPRGLIPLAAAAGLAFALWASPSLVDRALHPGGFGEMIALEFDDEEILVRALDHDLSDDEFHLLVTGRSNPEVLLSFAVGGR
jgi:hypothetical protein